MIKVTIKEMETIANALSTIDTMYHINVGSDEERQIIAELRKQMIKYRSILDCAYSRDRLMYDRLTKEEAIAVLRTSKSTKISHISFAPNEHLVSGVLGEIYDEDGNLYEDWQTSIHNGLRAKTEEKWQSDWFIKK